MSRRSKICTRGATRIYPRPSSSRCCPPESNPGTAIRGWYISSRSIPPVEGWPRSILFWPVPLPRYVPFRANVRPLFRFWSFIELHGLLQGRVIQFRDLVDVLQRLLGFVRDFLFGELFVVELNNFLDRPCALAKVFANRNEFLDDN